MKLYTLVGLKYRNAEKFVAELPAGEPLTLIRERDNPHDHFAIQVHAQGRFVAYVKSAEAKDLAKMMDTTMSFMPLVGSLVHDKGWHYIDLGN